MAAHLHDSVLQTLALIQRNGRRSPRAWCCWPAARSGSCGTGCTAAASTGPARTLADARPRPGRGGRGSPRRPRRARRRRRPPRSTTRPRALVGAVREALVNAAKHAGRRRGRRLRRGRTATASVAFVRDRGPGFDPERRPAGPARDRRLDPRTAGPLRRARPTGDRARRGHRGGSWRSRDCDRLGRGCSSSTITSCSAPGCGPSSATAVDVVGDAADVDAAVERHPCDASPRSCCSTSTSPAAAGGRWSRPSAPEPPRCGSWPCRCPTPPRT